MQILTTIQVVGYHVGLIVSMNTLRVCDPKVESSILSEDILPDRYLVD